MLRILNILALLTTFVTLATANKLTTVYIEDYKIIAVAEMRKSGIPASIKLAQGILESDLGRSELAFKANNHFGIKCGKDWTGKTFYQMDDDTDSTGMIVESCFRVYGHPSESYAAHTNFLTNPSKRSRYGFLFDLSVTDYVAWANGLKSSGYATDPSYPDKLVRIIEDHKLFLLDQGYAPMKPVGQVVLQTPEKSTSKTKDKVKESTTEKPIIVADNRKKKTESSAKTETKPTKSSTPSTNTTKYLVDRRNDLRFITAQGGETLSSIARLQGVDVFDLLSYNEGINTQHSILDKGEIVYLVKKKKSSDVGFHIVKKGESLYDIAQMYGVRLESLCIKNNLKSDAEIVAGEQVSLSKILSKKETPKHNYNIRFDRYLDMGDTK